MLTRLALLLGLVALLAVTPATQSARADTYRYIDESGNIFFVDSVNKVPVKFRDQVLPPPPTPVLSKRDLKKLERMQRKEYLEQAGLSKKKKKSSSRESSKDESRDQPKEKRSAKSDRGAVKEEVLLFTSPGCAECDNLERFLKENRVKFKTMDIVKNQKSFEQFDRLGAGAKLPITQIGARVIKGYQPQAILREAAAVGATKGGKRKR